VPDHNPIRLGTLAGIIEDVARHFNLSEEEFLTGSDSEDSKVSERQWLGGLKN
jgi:hypothetical protein